MKYDAALDVSTSKSAVCVLNRQDGSVVLETTVETNATAILAALKPYVGRLHLVGHESPSYIPHIEEIIWRDFFLQYFQGQMRLPAMLSRPI